MKNFIKRTFSFTMTVVYLALSIAIGAIGIQFNSDVIYNILMTISVVFASLAGLAILITGFCKLFKIEL